MRKISFINFDFNEYLTQGGVDMFIYDELNELEDTNESYGVSPLSYTVLDCAR